MYYLYIVRCADNSLYCGQTADVTKRIREHNFIDSKSAKYTKGRRPVQLVYIEQYATVSLALKREAYIKKLPKTKKEALILSKTVI